MANEKREMINKWGFWGLIVFVWIPFMAFGVLVGAMLGLFHECSLPEYYGDIYWRCTASGPGLTAEGIVKFMHQYKLEAVIPLMIIVFVGAAFLHVRSAYAGKQNCLKTHYWTISC